MQYVWYSNIGGWGERVMLCGCGNKQSEFQLDQSRLCPFMAMAKKNIPVSPQSFAKSVTYKSNHSKLSFYILRLDSGPTRSHTASASCFLWRAQSLHHVRFTVNTKLTWSGGRENHSILSFALTGSPCWEGCQEEEVLSPPSPEGMLEGKEDFNSK